MPGGNDAIRNIGWELENSKVELILVSRLTDVAGPRIHMRPINGLPMVHVDLPQYSGFTHAVKRIFDVVVAGTAIILLSPLFAAIAIGVRLSSAGARLLPPGAGRAHGARLHHAEVPFDGRRTPRSGSASCRTGTRATACSSR